MLLTITISILLVSGLYAKRLCLPTLSSLSAAPLTPRLVGLVSMEAVARVGVRAPLVLLVLVV